jgi:NADPH:quinone reductase-like Zn-dependent oxidoreductase
MNVDDCFPLASLGRVEGGDGVVEGCDVADVRPQSSVPHPLDDLTELATIGLDDEVDHQAVRGPRLGRPDDGHQCSSGSDQARGPLLDVAADDIEHQIDAADVFQGVVVESDRGQLGEIVQRVRDGRLRTNIGNIATLDDAIAALNPTERRTGKTIIHVRP